MVGLSLDLSAVDWSSPFIWIFSIVVTAVAIAGKDMQERIHLFETGGFIEGYAE